MGEGANRDYVAVCGVCPHACAIREGSLGLCGARGCKNGQVVDLSFGEATALALDPIEKKPLARFRPDSLILSFGSYGCNLRCSFCQNADISVADARSSIRTAFLSPEDLVERAVQAIPQGNVGIALTYNEPLIAPEYLVRVGELVREAGLALVVVTNGYVTPGTFEEVAPFIDAMNIDLKCFSDEAYATLGAPGGFEVVKGTIAAAVAAGIHVEVTTLVVPGLSDDPVGFEDAVRWLASLDPRIPLHITRFFPRYRMADAAPTDLCLMRRLASIAKAHLECVYLGNV